MLSENLILGQSFGIYGTNLTDGLRHDSCITVNQSTPLNIIFNLGKEYSFESISVYFEGNIIDNRYIAFPVCIDFQASSFIGEH